MTEQPHVNADAILPERAPSLGVPVRFFAVGLLFLAALLLLILGKAPMLVQEYLHNPVTLAATHLFTLGFGGSIASGALYQLLPVLLHSRLYSESLTIVHLVLHGIGVTLMALGFYNFRTLWTASGGILVTLGAVLFIMNIALTLRRAERWNWHGVFLGTAVGFYAVTLSWGLVLAFNQRFGFLGEVEGASLGSHLVLGFGGWFTLLIFAVGLKLIPMFEPSRALPPLLVSSTCGAMAVGVLLMIAGLVAGNRPLQWMAVLMMSAASMAYATGLTFAHLRRRSSPLDHSVRFALTAAGALVISTLATVAGFAGRWEYRGLQAGLLLFFALAWVGGNILGMLLRIVPFVVWLHRFRHRAKQERIPFLHEMFRHDLGRFAHVAWFAGVLTLTMGLVFGVSWPVQVGAGVCLTALAAHAAALGETLAHARPGTPPRHPGTRL